MSRKSVIVVSFALVFLMAGIFLGCMSTAPSGETEPSLPAGPGTQVFKPVANESGCIRTEGNIDSSVHLVGDDWNNQIWRSFASFDISSLAGRNVTNAKFVFKGRKKGEPFTNLGQLLFAQVEWGPRPLRMDDFKLAQIHIFGSFDTESGEIDVTSYVQEAVSKGDDRYQVRGRLYSHLSNNDSEPDQIDLDMTLEVTYE